MVREVEKLTLLYLNAKKAGTVTLLASPAFHRAFSGAHRKPRQPVSSSRAFQPGTSKLHPYPWFCERGYKAMKR